MIHDMYDVAGEILVNIDPGIEGSRSRIAKVLEKHTILKREPSSEMTDVALNIADHFMSTYDIRSDRVVDAVRTAAVEVLAVSNLVSADAAVRRQAQDEADEAVADMAGTPEVHRAEMERDGAAD